MVLFDREEGGADTGTPWHGMNLHLGWTRGQNHMQIAGPKREPISLGGEGGRVYISFRKENLCGVSYVV